MEKGLKGLLPWMEALLQREKVRVYCLTKQEEQLKQMMGLSKKIIEACEYLIARAKEKEEQ